MDMRRRAVRLYDAQMKPMGELRTAEVVDLKLRMIPLSTAVVNVPEADAGAADFRTFVELFDAGGRRIDLFRVSEVPKREHGEAGMARLACDQALCTLKDDILPGYVQLGGATQDLRGAIEAVLAYQTGPVRWELERCDFATRYEYGMSCENLLAALMKLLEPLEDWMIATNTQGGRLRLSILRQTEADAGELRYARNMSQIVETVREEGFATRLYPLGYGEGVNQLNIRDVNGGCPYIDAPTKAIWGIVARPYVDTTITDAGTLLAAAKAALAVSQNPQVTYSVTAADLSMLTGEEADAFYPGRMMRVIHKKEGIALRTRVTEVHYPRPGAEPGNARLTLATQTRDVATVIAELTRRSYESRLYGQGSTFIFADSIEQNADADTPAEGDIYIPENMIHVNAVKLKVKLMAYRADSRGAAAGGGTTRTTAAGGASTQTSTASGGGMTTSGGGGALEVVIPGRTLHTMIYTERPVAPDDYTSMSHTNAPVDMADLNTIKSATDAATGSTYANAEQVTGVSRDENGIKSSTDAAGGGSTGSAGGGNTGISRDAAGAKTSTDLAGLVTAVSRDAAGAKNSTDEGGAWTDVSRDAAGAKSSTDTGGGGSTYANAEQTTGVSRDENGVKSSTDSAGSHRHSSLNTHRHTYSGGTYTSYNGAGETTNAGRHSHGMDHWHTMDGHSHSMGSHSHGMNHYHDVKPHSHGMSHYHDVEPHSHGMSHWHTIDAHSHSMGEHAHGMDHWHTMDGHTHGLGGHTHGMMHRHGMDHIHDVTHEHKLPSFTAELPSHTHSVTLESHSHEVSIPSHSHKVTLDDHRHGIEYGIYKGPKASGFVVEIDGVAVPQEAFDERGEGDIAPYLAKDASGRIRRSHFHTLSVRPVASENNPQGLCRIRASWNAQVFISSLVGVQY